MVNTVLELSTWVICDNILFRIVLTGIVWHRGDGEQDIFTGEEGGKDTSMAVIVFFLFQVDSTGLSSKEFSSDFLLYFEGIETLAFFVLLRMGNFNLGF